MTAVRALLAGETTMIDGQPVRMLHAEDLAVPRPVDVEIWLSVFGPAGSNSPNEIADGIIVGMPMESRTAHRHADARHRASSPAKTAAANGSEKRRAHGKWSRYHEAYAIAGAGRRRRDAAADEPGATRSSDSPRRANDICSPIQGHVTHLTERDHRLLDHADDGHGDNGGG